MTSPLTTMVATADSGPQGLQVALDDSQDVGDGPHACLATNTPYDQETGPLTLRLCSNVDREFSEVDPLLPNNRLLLSKSTGTEIRYNSDERRSRARHMPSESVCGMVLQILVPFLLAGFGTVLAGMLLDVVQHWKVFESVTELFILVPALLGLKGNLEMTLASRLHGAAPVLSLSPSQVNVGKMNSSREKWDLIIGNLALKQVQATVLGFLAALAASALGWILEEKLQMSHVALLCCSSVVTAFTASMLQGLIMVGVIVGSKRTGINPDNVATPIAASFGDLITLATLACISRLLYNCMGGLILDKTMSDPNLQGIVVYTPVINGIGGNLVAIQSSRVATCLHFHYALGELPHEAKGCCCPCRNFCGKGPNSRSAQVLLLMVIPGHLIFLYTIYLMQGSHTSPTPIFSLFYLAAALVQVSLLLCTADWMVHCLWRNGRDPDSFSIPYLTALGDLLGTALLALSFHLLWVISDKDSDVGD